MKNYEESTTEARTHEINMDKNTIILWLILLVSVLPACVVEIYRWVVKRRLSKVIKEIENKFLDM